MRACSLARDDVEKKDDDRRLTKARNYAKKNLAEYLELRIIPNISFLYVKIILLKILNSVPSNDCYENSLFNKFLINILETACQS